MTNVYNPIASITTTEVTYVDDVVAYDGFYDPNGYPGWTTCAAGATYGGTNPRRYCKPQEIRYNLSYTNTYNYLAGRRMIACHEFGHTLGLQHPTHSHPGTASCMHWTADTSQTLKSHDIGLLNDNY